MATQVVEHTETEALLKALPASVRIGTEGTTFFASCYEPNDVLKGHHCYGRAETLAAAIDVMLDERAKAMNRAPVLRTAWEVKSAVQALIRQHDAAPAAFRDAVDELQVRS